MCHSHFTCPDSIVKRYDERMGPGKGQEVWAQKMALEGVDLNPGATATNERARFNNKKLRAENDKLRKEIVDLRGCIEEQQCEEKQREPPCTDDSAERQRLMASQAKVRKLKHKLKKATAQVDPADKCMMWLYSKVKTGASNEDMRLHRKCEARTKMRGKSNSIGSEEGLLKSWRKVCSTVEKYLVPASTLNPDWEGHYADIEALLQHDVAFHSTVEVQIYQGRWIRNHPHWYQVSTNRRHSGSSR